MGIREAISAVEGVDSANDTTAEYEIALTHVNWIIAAEQSNSVYPAECCQCCALLSVDLGKGRLCFCVHSQYVITASLVIIQWTFVQKQMNCIVNLFEFVYQYYTACKVDRWQLQMSVRENINV